MAIWNAIVARITLNGNMECNCRSYHTKTVFVSHSFLCITTHNFVKSVPKGKAHTAQLLIYYDAHLKHNHTIVTHITLTIQVIFVISTNC